MLVLFYASIKLVHLVTRHNPDIAQHRVNYFYGPDKIVDLKESNVRFAFNIEGFLDGETKNDPRYVKYIARNYGKKNGVLFEHLYEIHICSENELNEIGVPSRDSTSVKHYMGQHQHRQLYCLNWDELEEEELSVYGVENDDNYQRFEFILLPCNYIHA